MNLICLVICIMVLLLGLPHVQAEVKELVIPDGGISLLPGDALSAMRLNIRDKSLGHGEIIEVEGLPFARAMSVSTVETPSNAWGIQFTGRANGAIEKGDVCLLSFWIRGPHSEDESGDAVARASVQRSRPPHEKIAQVPTTANATWRHVVKPFKAKQTLPDGQVGVTFHLGFYPQTVELGGVKLINYGGSMDMKDLPNSHTSYKGRSPDAPWRKEAADRIEKIRKADLVIKVVDADGKPVKDATVDIKMTRHAFGFGSAVTAHLLSIDDDDGRKYRQIVESLYNKVVLENDLKWWAWNTSKANKQRSRFRMEYTDKALEWLNERDIEVRGHYITWAPLKKEEIQKYDGQADKLRADLFAHMEEKVPKVGKRVGEWDAINHIVGWGTTISKLLGGDHAYVEIIKRSRELAPHAELWINEGAVLPRGDRRLPYERMVKYLMDNDAAPDGVGFMGHFGATSLTPIEDLYKVFGRFAVLIPNLQITELDVRVGNDEQLQADYLRDVITIGFSHPAFQAVVMWGFWEGRHWKPDAALYREDWSIKPAGEVWKDLVFNQWWTDETGKTDGDGTLKARGFLGDYEIRAKHGKKEKILKLSLSTMGKDVQLALE